MFGSFAQFLFVLYVTFAQFLWLDFPHFLQWRRKGRRRRLRILLLKVPDFTAVREKFQDPEDNRISGYREGRGREGRNRVQGWEFRSFCGFCQRIMYVCFSVFLENEPGGSFFFFWGFGISRHHSMQLTFFSWPSFGDFLFVMFGSFAQFLFVLYVTFAQFLWLDFAHFKQGRRKGRRRRLRILLLKVPDKYPDFTAVRDKFT